MTRWRRVIRIVAWTALGVAGTTFPPMRAEAAPLVVDQEEFTLELGLRIQPRMELQWFREADGQTEWQRDFLIRRTRLKAGGSVHQVLYKLEWRIDRTDQISTPAAGVENGYLQYPLAGPLELRAGLYDQPFSRDRLTSDSKQLFVDRGLVSDVADAVGLADNAVGFELLGKVRDDHVEYTLGAFDNRLIPRSFQKWPMFVGRLDLNLASTKDVFTDTHFGDGSWCSIGVNGSYQGAIADSTAEDGIDRAVGIDGILDLPLGPGRLCARGEANDIRIEPPGPAAAVHTTVWMVGAGFLIQSRLQPIVRFDQARVEGGATRNVTHVGLNFYQDGHQLKIQGDVRLEAGTGEPVDGVTLQTQIDF